MYVYIYLYIYTHIHTYIDVHIMTHTHTHTHTQIPAEIEDVCRAHAAYQQAKQDETQQKGTKIWRENLASVPTVRCVTLALALLARHRTRTQSHELYIEAREKRLCSHIHTCIYV